MTDGQSALVAKDSPYIGICRYAQLESIKLDTNHLDTWSVLFARRTLLNSTEKESLLMQIQIENAGIRHTNTT